VRIDLFLKNTLLFKKRSEAKRMCNHNLVRVNGHTVKPSKVITQGDIIEIDTTKGVKKLRILEIPEGNVKKNEVTLYYEEYQ
jgi:ribosomal 50S subunit-recycling heat shock protein